MSNVSAVELFTFPVTGQQVRAVMIDDEPWFVANDVCAVLGYSHTGSALRTLREREKGEHPMHTPGGVQDLKVISEPGLYRLIMRSNRDEAEAFQDWVVEEVLPAIRKTGVYAVAPQFQIPQTFPEALRLAADQAEEILRLQVRNEQLTVKAEAYDEWINGKGCYLVGTVAKMLKIGPKALWDFLYEEKILIDAPSTKRHREPYAAKPSTTWFEVKPVDPKNANGHAVKTTYVLPYGAEKIRLLLIKRGVLPSEQLALLPGL